MAAAKRERIVIDAALRLAAERGWSHVTMHDLAEAASEPLERLHALFPNREAVLCAFARMIDREVLAGLDPELADEPVRERLFAILMARFDALNPHKEGVRALVNASASDLSLALGGILQLAGSMAWMLEAAGLSGAGVAGTLRIKGLMAVHLAVLRVWLSDTSEDMAPTMAALDRHLRRAERLALWLEGCAGRTRASAEPRSEPESRS